MVHPVFQADSKICTTFFSKRMIRKRTAESNERNLARSTSQITACAILVDNVIPLRFYGKRRLRKYEFCNLLPTYFLRDTERDSYATVRAFRDSSTLRIFNSSIREYGSRKGKKKKKKGIFLLPLHSGFSIS